MSHAENSAITLEGTVEPQFAPLRDAFFARFEQELGAAVAVYQRGKLVVARAAGLSRLRNNILGKLTATDFFRHQRNNGSGGEHALGP